MLWRSANLDGSREMMEKYSRSSSPCRRRLHSMTKPSDAIASAQYEKVFEAADTASSFHCYRYRAHMSRIALYTGTQRLLHRAVLVWSGWPLRESTQTILLGTIECGGNPHNGGPLLVHPCGVANRTYGS